LRTFFDGTLGAGGHSAMILETHPEIERLIACDRDPSAIEIAKEKLQPWSDKVELIQGNFSEINRYLDEKKIPCVDGIFLDLGVSSMQLDQEERGFSFSQDGPLDMRMDTEQRLTAEEIINQFSEKELGRIFQEYGEEPRWKRAAKCVVTERRKKRITTTKQLAEIFEKNFSRLRGRLHPATLVFQALRIYVNQELEALDQALSHGIDRLCPKGRMGVISFHSLEDRMVKQRFRAEKGKLTLLNRKPICPSKEEMRENPRSRSAKLRFVEKNEVEH